jgi:H+/Cl- antiporter ClcA
MASKISQFLAIIFTALALLPGGAHLMTLAAKIDMPEQPYFAVQQIYRGWAWLGIVIFAAIFANFGSAFLTRYRRRQFRLSLAAGLLIAATLAIFFAWIYPANQATGNWSSAPEDWEQLRIQWEYSHAVNAVLTFIALLCSVGAALSADSRSAVTYAAAATSRGTTARRDAALDPPDARIAETRRAHLRRPIDVA